MKNFRIKHICFQQRAGLISIVRWLPVLIAILFTGSASMAQQRTLVIGGSTPNLFIVHTVTAKENFYSIGRMYNVPPKDVAAYNNLQFENGLSVGESIKIPLNANNFSQSKPAGNGEALVPVYHTVQPKEGLYRVSLNYNKVPIASLKKWNHIQADAVSVGSPLIVGYLKVARGGSPLAGTRPDVTAASADKPVKTEPVNTEANPVSTAPATKNAETNKQENKDVAETGAHKGPVTTTVRTGSKVNFSGGYFKRLYEDQVQSKNPVNGNGSAGVFKSTSGWQDGKYYCFNNEAPPGTIVKITDSITGKSVYAKVLDAIPDIKQNSDLTVILSNAAAEELGAAEGKFDCAISYVK